MTDEEEFEELSRQIDQLDPIQKKLLLQNLENSQKLAKQFSLKHNIPMEELELFLKEYFK